MDSPSEQILVIDDDRELCSLLAEYLKPEGYNVETAYNGEMGMKMALSGKYGLLVLDVMLPGRLNGFDVLQRLRAKTDMPVLMLSARGEDVDRIVGLEMGADDYLAKPFNPRELLARVRTIQRRSRVGTLESIDDTATRYRVGDLELDSGTYTAYCAGETVELTVVEFRLLEVLLRNVGRVVSREDLAKEVLERALSPYDRSIDVHVSKLRKKLGQGTMGSERIKAIRGSGYIYVSSSSPMKEQPTHQPPAEKENPDDQK